MVPLYVAIGAATFICGGYMIKHFGGHTDVCFAKSLRTDADHNGKSQHRLNTHNGHFGMRSVNKTSLSFFPFKFTPMDSALTPPPLIFVRGIPLDARMPSPRVRACALRLVGAHRRRHGSVTRP